MTTLLQRLPENFTYGDTPTDTTVQAVLKDVLMQEGEFHIAPIAMSREHDGCRVIALLKYFGETLNSETCGHCDTCLGRPVQALPVLKQMALTATQCEQIDKLANEKHPALAHPRQMARFLCGLNSPATTRDRLTKHEAFGTLEQIPFHDILDACEKRH